MTGFVDGPSEHPPPVSWVDKKSPDSAQAAQKTRSGPESSSWRWVSLITHGVDFLKGNLLQRRSKTGDLADSIQWAYRLRPGDSQDELDAKIRTVLLWRETRVPLEASQISES